VHVYLCFLVFLIAVFSFDNLVFVQYCVCVYMCVWCVLCLRFSGCVFTVVWMCVRFSLFGSLCGICVCVGVVYVVFEFLFLCVLCVLLCA